MKIIGITGPSGSGKSLLCRSLEKNRIFCIDADKVYHSLLIPPSECLEDIRAAFGEGVFADDGTLDRVALGAVVFSDEKKLELLNKTVLSRVIAKIREIIAVRADIGEEIIVVDAPTLIESGFDKECDIVVSVIAPTDARKKRIIERDAISEQRAEARIGAQKSDAFYREHSDMVIENSGTLEQFEQKISDFMAQLRAGGLI